MSPSRYIAQLTETTTQCERIGRDVAFHFSQTLFRLRQALCLRYPAVLAFGRLPFACSRELSGRVQYRKEEPERYRHYGKNASPIDGATEYAPVLPVHQR